MRPPAIEKFGFRIRTRKGIVIDVALPGRDAADALRKLHQIYRDCDVLASGLGSADRAPQDPSHGLRAAAR
jgi:hypothetical protein